MIGFAVDVFCRPSNQVPSPVPSQTSLDLSSNDSSESDVGGEENEFQNSDLLNNSSSHSPWLRKPTLEVRILI